jgi:hypothetical protein
MGKLPGFIFYPGDWMKDPELRCVSSGARGLWIDMLCLMFESVRRGYLQLHNGKVVTAEHLARMTGNSTDDTSRWLQELEDSGVFSRTEHGMIYSRRQVSDQTRREKTKDRVRNHRSVTEGTCNSDVTQSVTPIPVNEYVTEDSPPVVEIRTKLETFDFEEFMQSARKIWPRADRSMAAEAAGIDAIEAEVKSRSCHRSEAASHILGRLQQIAAIVGGWPRDQKRFIPQLEQMLRGKYQQQNEFWERHDAQQDHGPSRVPISRTVQRAINNISATERAIQMHRARKAAAAEERTVGPEGSSDGSAYVSGGADGCDE